MDKELLQQAFKAGEDYRASIRDVIKEANFEEWYSHLNTPNKPEEKKEEPHMIWWYDLSDHDTEEILLRHKPKVKLPLDSKKIYKLYLCYAEIGSIQPQEQTLHERMKKFADEQVDVDPEIGEALNNYSKIFGAKTPTKDRIGGQPEFNNKPCKNGCNCLSIAEQNNGGQGVMNYECLGKEQIEEKYIMLWCKCETPRPDPVYFGVCQGCGNNLVHD